MSGQRDELITKARSWAKNFDGTKSNANLNNVYYINALADALEAIKPRTITTVEELDALPKRPQPVVLGRRGDAFQWGEECQSREHAWFMTGDASPLTSAQVAAFGPLTVLYEPTPGGTE